MRLRLPRGKNFFVVTLRGREVSPPGSWCDCWGWLRRNLDCSPEWAMAFEGYAIRPA